MEQLLIEIVLIAVLIIINGLFSMTEIAVVSARKVRLAGSAANGNAGAATALELQQNPERFLSTVQIGITLIGILSGALGGAMLSDEVAAIAAQVPLFAPYSTTIGFAVVIVIITFFSLVIGELVPKNIALNMPETIASVFSRPMKLVSKITSPFVWLLSWSTTLILKLFRISESSEAAITEEEIRAHIAHGTELGVLDVTERELIEGVIELDDQRVPSIMTSRLKIAWLNLDDDAETNKQKLIDSPYSRLPVCRGSLDNILGVVKARDLLSHFLSGNELDIESVMKEPVFVPETQTVLELLETFRVSHSLMALVIDEFGSVEGVVTMNDVLEEIVGELQTNGNPNSGVVVREDGSMLIDGELSIADFREATDLPELPEDERDSYQTLAGFMLARLEKVPNEGDHFEWNGFKFEVMDMDGRRVDKVLVTRLGVVEEKQ